MACFVLLAVFAVVIAVQQTSDRPLELSVEQRLVIDQLESVLLHDTPVIQYDRVTPAHDGRGLIAGRGDFSTAEGETLALVEEYGARESESPLVRDYLPILKELARQGNPDVTRLAGFPAAWQVANLDPLLRHLQDDRVSKLQFQPALAIARELGVSRPLGLAILYDTLIQHGNRNNLDSLASLIERTNTTAGGAPRDIDEQYWLATFLDRREETLLRPAQPTKATIWPYTAGRVQALRDLLADGNMDLTAPLVVNPYGVAHTIEPVELSPALAGPDWQFTESSPEPSVPPTPDRSNGPTLTPTGARSPSPPIALPNENSAGVPVSQALVDYPTFASVVGITLHGSATKDGDAVRLVDGQQQAGALWASKSIDTSHSFSAMFLARISGYTDGLAFVVRALGSRTIGSPGSSLGYGDPDEPAKRISPSVAVELDTFGNSYDPPGGEETIAICLNGNVRTPLAWADPPVPLTGASVTAWVEYDATQATIRIYVSRGTVRPPAATLTASLDLPAIVGQSAFMGFTAGAGDSWSDQHILAWRVIA